MARISRDRYSWRGEESTRPFAEWLLTYRLHRAGLPVPAPIAARYRACRLHLYRRPHHRAAPTVGSLAECLGTGALSVAHVDFDRALHPPVPRPGRVSCRSQCAQCAAERGRRLPDRLRPLPAARARTVARRRIWCGCAARWTRSPGALPAERFGESDWHGLLDGYRQSSGGERLAEPKARRASVALPLSPRRLPAAPLVSACCLWRGLRDRSYWHNFSRALRIRRAAAHRMAYGCTRCRSARCRRARRW